MKCSLYVDLQSLTDFIPAPHPLLIAATPCSCLILSLEHLSCEGWDRNRKQHTALSKLWPPWEGQGGLCCVTCLSTRTLHCGEMVAMGNSRGFDTGPHAQLSGACSAQDSSAYIVLCSYLTVCGHWNSNKYWNKPQTSGCCKKRTRSLCENRTYSWWIPQNVRETFWSYRHSRQ